MDHFFHLIFVMILFGVLGGIVNYILSETKTKARMLRYLDPELLKSLLTGVAASFLVPLFLNMISSNIMQESETDRTQLLIFCGFCMIAAVSSKTFIKTLSNKILERVIKVEDAVTSVKDEVHPMVLTHTEPDERLEAANEKDVPAEGQLLRKKLSRSEMDQFRILKGLAFSNFTFRTVKGLAEESGLDVQEVGRYIEECVSKGYACRMTNGLGNKICITENGRNYLDSLGRKEEV